MLQLRLPEKALAFARKAHAGQKRKYTGDPYIVHPIAVASLVTRVRHTDAMVAAALLHDTREDTAVTDADIRTAFGDEVADLVDWLTDVSTSADGNRAERKKRDRDHIGAAPAAAQTIKLADVIDNSATIAALDPVFARVYLPEKIALLDVLQSGDPDLLGKAHRQLEESMRKIK